MADRAVKGTVFSAESQKNKSSCGYSLRTPGDVRHPSVTLTCDDVLDGAIFALVHMAAVFALFPSEFSEQLLLLPFAFVRWRLEQAEGGGSGHPLTNEHQ